MQTRPVGLTGAGTPASTRLTRASGLVMFAVRNSAVTFLLAAAGEVTFVRPTEEAGAAAGAAVDAVVRASCAETCEMQLNVNKTRNASEVTRCISLCRRRPQASTVRSICCTVVLADG